MWLIYIIIFKLVFQLTNFPSGAQLLTPNRGTSLEVYLEGNIPEDQQESYLIPDRTLSKHGRVLDIRQKSDTSCNCFTKAYSHYAEGTGSVLQSNDQESLQERFAAFEKSGNTEDLKPLGLRYFTPREVANLMAFPDHFKFPPSVSVKTRYRLLGNSLNVLVVANLFRLLML